MTPLSGKTLILLGVILIVAGAVLTFSGKVPFIGRLPGDIRIERENFSLYLPFGTCLLFSLAASLLHWLIRR